MYVHPGSFGLLGDADLVDLVYRFAREPIEGSGSRSSLRPARPSLLVPALLCSSLLSRPLPQVYAIPGAAHFYALAEDLAVRSRIAAFPRA